MFSSPITRRGIAFIVEVPRLGTEHSALENLVGAAQTGAVHNADMGVNHAVVADFNIALDMANGYIVTFLPIFAFGSTYAFSLIIILNFEI